MIPYVQNIDEHHYINFHNNSTNQYNNIHISCLTLFVLFSTPHRQTKDKNTANKRRRNESVFSEAVLNKSETTLHLSSSKLKIAEEAEREVQCTRFGEQYCDDRRREKRLFEETQKPEDYYHDEQYCFLGVDEQIRHLRIVDNLREGSNNPLRGKGVEGGENEDRNDTADEPQRILPNDTTNNSARVTMDAIEWMGAQAIHERKEYEQVGLIDGDIFSYDVFAGVFGENADTGLEDPEFDLSFLPDATSA